jgi:hypothetical protein
MASTGCTVVGILPPVITVHRGFWQIKKVGAPPKSLVYIYGIEFAASMTAMTRRDETLRI